MASKQQPPPPPRRQRKPRLPKVTLAKLPNTIDGLFLYWSPTALRLMLQAISRLIGSAENRRTEQAFWTKPEPLYITIPALVQDGTDAPTITWFAALHRFGCAPTHHLKLASWAIWARALILGMLVMTNSARELMFADAVALLRLRNARSPSLERRRFWVPRISTLFNDWFTRDYVDERRFVLECAAVYYVDSPSDYDDWAPLFAGDTMWPDDDGGGEQDGEGGGEDEGKKDGPQSAS